MQKQMLAILTLCFCLLAAAPAYAAESGEITVVDNITESEESIKIAPKTYPNEIKNVTESGKTLICKTFEVSLDTSPQELIEQDLQRDGWGYTVRDILKKELEPVPETKMISKTVSLEVQTDDKEKICSKLSPTLEYDEGGFTGVLSLDEDSVTAKATESEGYIYTVRDVRQLFGVNRNDPYYLPQTVCKNGATLQLTNVDWFPMGEWYDVNSVPGLYNARAFYSGKAYGSKPTAFEASATYTGEVSRMVPGNIQYTLVYEPAELLTTEQQFAEDATKAKRWIIYTAGGLLLVALAGAGCFLVLELRGKKQSEKVKKKKFKQDFDSYDDLDEELPERRMRIPEAMRQMERSGMEVEVDE